MDLSSDELSEVDESGSQKPIKTEQKKDEENPERMKIKIKIKRRTQKMEDRRRV